MLVNVDGRSMVDNDEQPSKVELPMEVKLSGKLTDAKLEQSRKASLPMLVRSFGRRIVASDEQPLKV